MTQAVSGLLPFVLLAILGAVHCAGMCGGFAVAVAARAERSPGSFLPRQLAYVVGKALTYAVLGLTLSAGTQAAARAGSELSVEVHPHAALSLARDASAWLAGLTMIWFGLRMLGVPLAFPSPDRAAPPGRRGGVRALFDGALSLPGSAGALATGLATGFLPCGLSWSAFALAAGLDPLTAFLGLLLFGLSTAPALLLSAWGWRGLSQHHRATAARLAGPLLLLFGLFTLVRGGVGAEHVDVLPDCCGEAGESTTPD